MDPQHQRRLDRLLTPGAGLSRPEKEAILTEVLEQVGTEGGREHHSQPWWTLIGSFVAAAGLVMALPTTTAPSREFGARGSGHGEPGLTILCDDKAVQDTCRHGSELGFEVTDVDQLPYVAIYARRPDNTVIWYAPAKPTDPSLPLERGTATTLVPRRVHVGDEHQPGCYQVMAVFTDNPVEREHVKALVLGHGAPGERVAFVKRQICIS